MKDWRIGGPVPTVDFWDLQWNIIEQLTAKELAAKWDHIVEFYGAANKHCDTFGTLVPHWSFCESVNKVLNVLDITGAVPLAEIPLLAMEQASPKNWCYMLI